MSKSEQCDPMVWKHGRSIGIFEGSREEADAYCSTMTESTGRRHDWHYIAGRINLLAIPESTQELLDQLALAAAPSLSPAETAKAIEAADLLHSLAQTGLDKCDPFWQQKMDDCADAHGAICAALRKKQ